MALRTEDGTVTTMETLLATAVTAADHAGRIIRDRAPGELTAKGDRDYASEVDYAVERELRALLAEETPAIGFLGEEEGSSGDGAELEWTLDPVDGTINFAHGLPLCGVSLALMEGKRPILGVIDLPFLGERYTAVRSHGAQRNGEPIRVSSTSRLHDAIVNLGDYAVGDRAAERNAPRLALTAAMAAQALRVRMLGSAAIDLAWLACGRTDASVILSNKPWDVAAGIIIAREAGASVVDFDGSDHDADSTATLAAPSGMVNELASVVRSTVRNLY